MDRLIFLNFYTVSILKNYSDDNFRIWKVKSILKVVWIVKHIHMTVEYGIQICYRWFLQELYNILIFDSNELLPGTPMRFFGEQHTYYCAKMPYVSYLIVCTVKSASKFIVMAPGYSFSCRQHTFKNIQTDCHLI